MTTTYQCACCGAPQADADVTIFFSALDNDRRVVKICYECEDFALLKRCGNLEELTAARDSVTVRSAPRG